jgi:transcriptional regulator with XRE-family HTH domain
MTTKDRPLSYWIAVARMGFEEDLARLMSKKGLNKADLAREAGVSPPFITKVLNGTNNYTLKTMAKLARAMGAVLEIRLADDKSEVVRVLDVAAASELEQQHSFSLTSSSGTSSSDVTRMDEWKRSKGFQEYSVSITAAQSPLEKHHG